MKKQVISINLHSFVDLITNSSTELFVCDTKKSIEAIKSLLVDMLELYNKVHEEDLKFEDVFGDIYQGEIDYENAWIFLEYYFAESILLDKIDKQARQELPDFDNYHSITETEPRYKIMERFDKNQRAWIDKYKKQIDEILNKKILIFGALSNSIPFELFDMIESVFNAKRIHLG